MCHIKIKRSKIISDLNSINSPKNDLKLHNQC